MFNRIIKLTFAFAMLLVNVAFGQAPRTQLDNYIDTAFAQNQTLKEKQFDLDKALYALKEAKSMYLPTISFLGSYSKVNGGRTIDVPIGDLVNPIYTALNQLTNSSKYPMLKNESFLLNPDNFYDAKVHTSLPLINAEIRYNQLIKKKLINAQQAAVNVYKRSLVKDIKNAYYKYFQALQTVQTYRSTLILIRENIRQNESMLKNGIRNSTALLRSQTEEQKTLSAIVESNYTVKNAKSYFNFLLNRQLRDSIILDNGSLTISSTADTSKGITNREEIAQIKSMRDAYDFDYKLQKSGFIPKLNTFIDLGSQGFNFNVNDKTRYYFWGLNLQWDIFTGGQRKYKSLQSKASYNAASAQLETTNLSLRLELDQSYNQYQSATSSLKSARAQFAFAQKYYSDQHKAYKAGELLYIELLDAQNQLTTARLLVAEDEANVQIAAAELERDQAAYPINN
ncbi:MAG: TolC family protein [Mucilaginibacter sp.]